MKDITEQDQFKIVNLVIKNKRNEAYELECKLNKKGFLLWNVLIEYNKQKMQEKYAMKIK